MVDAFENSLFYRIDFHKLPAEVKERLEQKPGGVWMKFLLPNWRQNRYDLVRTPVGYPESNEGDYLRAKLSNARSGHGNVIL